MTKQQVEEKRIADQRTKEEEIARRKQEAEEARAFEQAAKQRKAEIRKQQEEVTKAAYQMQLEQQREAQRRKEDEQLSTKRTQLATNLTSQLIAKLPTTVGSESLKSAIETSVKNALAVAIPAGLSSKQQTEAMNELTALWKSNLTRANFSPIAGGFATQAAKGLVVGQTAKFVADFAAAAVAKRTSNSFAIEFARAATELAIVDAYAAKGGGWQAVLVVNGAKITEASLGLAIDTRSAAKSMKAFEVQVNDVIARAQRETDPAERARLHTTAIKAIATLNELKKEHPLINTLSNITVEGTVETLRSWMP